MISDAIRAGLSFVGVVNSLLLAVYLVFRKFDKRTSNILLSLIMVAISIRISKSLIFFLLKKDTDIFVLTLGHFAMSCIGPLTYLYFRSVLKKNFSFKIQHLLHFIFSIFVLVSFTRLIQNNFSFLIRHLMILFQYLVYLGLSGMVVLSSYRKLKDDERDLNFLKFVWFFIILLLVFLIWLGYFFHHILNIISITSAPLMFSLSLFILFYLVITHPDFSLSTDLFRLKKSKILPADAKQIYQRIVSEYKQNHTYTDPDLTLRTLSKIIDLPPYKISRAINLETGQSFTRFTNQFRIDEAMNNLRNKKTSKRNILDIALDCGFNSLSAFNSAFKKITGLTPSTYK